MNKKERVLEEHCAAMGCGDMPLKVASVPWSKDRLFCYWNDGEIERRDTYTVDNESACLESCAFRYAGETRWRHAN